MSKAGTKGRRDGGTKGRSDGGTKGKARTETDDARVKRILKARERRALAKLDEGKGYDSAVPFTVHKPGTLPHRAFREPREQHDLRLSREAVEVADEALFRGYLVSMPCAAGDVPDNVATFAQASTRRVAAHYDGKAERLIFFAYDSRDREDIGEDEDWPIRNGPGDNERY